MDKAMIKTEEIFEYFESEMNRLLKKDVEFWNAARIAAGNTIEKYTEDEVYKSIEPMRVLPNGNAAVSASLLHSEICMAHMTITDNEGNSRPMKYERVFE